MSKNGGNSGQNDPIKEGIKKAAIVCTGFSMLQSVRLIITGGAYAVKRFGIAGEETGIFIKMTLNTSEIFCVTGIIITTIYSMLRGNEPKTKVYDKYLSIALTWINFLAFVIIFISYYTGGTNGHLTFYYWSVVGSSLTYGLHQSMVLSMVTEDIAYYFMGLPMSGIQVLVYHIIFRYLYKKLKLSNIEFHLVINQIVIAMGLWLLSSIFWTYTFYDYDPEKEHQKLQEKQKLLQESQNGHQVQNGHQNGKNLTFIQRIGKALSPFLMYIFGMMMIFFFYPAIAPYEFVKPETGYKIDLCILFTSAMAASTLVVLVRSGVGPNRAWKGNYVYYHGAWFLFVVYYGCMLTFIICLHYPLTPIAQYIRERPHVVGILTVLLKTLDDFIRGISTSGISMQSEGQDGDMATLSNCIAQILLNVFSFLGMGYIKAYRMHKGDRDNWPTIDMTRTGALWYWVKRSCSGGWGAFLQSFTLNVRSCFESPDQIGLLSE